MLGHMWLNTFNNDVDEEVELIVIKFADNTKSGGVANILEEKERLN